MADLEPKHYHTIIVPITTSSGKLLLPLEIRIIEPPNQLSCCTANFATRVTSLAPLKPGRDRPNTWPIEDSASLSRRARYCFCKKTSLHLAVKQGRIDKIEKLMLFDDLIGVKDAFGKVSLHYSQMLEACDSRRVLDLFWLRMMTTRSDFAAVDDDLYESTGLSAIHVACLRDDHWSASRLLEKNSSLIGLKTQSSCPRWPNYTPLHFAVKYGSPEILSLLLNSDNVVDFINARDGHGFTPLHLACSRANVEAFRQLVNSGADPYASSNRMITTLRLAIQSGCEETIETVLEHVKENPMDNKGLTPLHYCCAKGLYANVLAFFEQGGADPDVIVHRFAPRMPGYTCLHIAVERNDIEMFRLLLENFANAEANNSDLLTVVEMVCWKVKDKNVREEMIEALTVNDYEIARTESCYVEDDVYKMLDAAYELVGEPVVLELEPEIVADKILDKLAFTKCVAMTRRQMSSLFLKYGGNERRFVKLIVKKDGKSIEPRLVYRSSYDHRLVKSNNNVRRKQETIYNYYVVNEEALKTLLTFGCDLSDDMEGLKLDYQIKTTEPQIFPSDIIFRFLNHQEIRRLVGLAGKNEAYWRRQASKQRRQNKWYANKFAAMTKRVEIELKEMKRLNFGSSTGTLLDLFRDLHKLCLFVKRKPKFVEWIDTQEFADKLPNLVGIMRMQCHKAVERIQLIEPACKRFGEMVNKGLGLDWIDDCMDNVLTYLSNDDLRRIANA